MQPELSELPASVQTLADVSIAVPGSYLVASGIMHIFGASPFLIPR